MRLLLRPIIGQSILHATPLTLTINPIEEDNLMIGKSKTKSLTLTWGVTVLLLFTINLAGNIYYNYTDNSFNNPKGASTTQECDTLRCYVIEGAGYFLKSHSDFLAFLNCVELEELYGMDYNVLTANLNSAVETMQAAKNTYLHLKQKADTTPYRQDVLDRLLTFDYDTFQVDNGLIESIFAEVKFFLYNGKIREMYGEILVHLDEILAVAGIIKAEIEAGRSPELKHLYRLNQSCSKSLLFGQYAAMVFLEIK